MANILRSLICKKVVQAISISGGKERIPSNLSHYIKIGTKNSQAINYEILCQHICKPKINMKESTLSETSSEALELISKLQVDDYLTAVYLEESNTRPKIKFEVCNKKIIKEVLNHICLQPESFWKSSDLFTCVPKQKIIVEFSSPNIAKPFHVGHLRSTIIGNFIGRLCEALNHEVIRINYIGDWGTQFGLLKYAYDLKMSKQKLEKDPIRYLYSLYVWINEIAETNEEVQEKAKQIFASMEGGDEAILKDWNLFRQLSIRDLTKIYERLNVTFDHYHGESMYRASEAGWVIQRMEEKGLLENQPDGKRSYLQDKKTPPVPIVKSDGSTLYITRDIAAAIHRYEQFNFDRMLYVVDASQGSHFVSLFNILKDLGYDWADRLQHVKFGRVRGMSTRKGTVVFLEDVLDEAYDLMKTSQTISKNTEFNNLVESEMSAESVGVSAVLVADLKKRRKKDYSFSWDAAIEASGSTGVRLQYAHCRLVRLERNCGVDYNDKATLESLVEPEVINIVQLLARFDEILLRSFEELESIWLTTYLFELSTAINKAFKVLNVKFAKKKVAQDRLMLFRAARHTLAAGMKILGLKPLERM